MRYLLIVLALLMTFSCRQESDENGIILDSEASVKILNDSAMMRFFETKLSDEPSLDSLNLSLNELEKAIKLDPIELESFTNKASILIYLKMDSLAIETLKQVANLKSDYAEVLSKLGFLNERNGKYTEAQEWYEEANIAYGNRIENDIDPINSRLNKAFLLFFTDDESNAMNAYFKIQEEHPKDPDVLFFEDLFENFDKEEFLKQL